MAKVNGVHFEDGSWIAYVNGDVVASGPDEAIIRAAWEFRAGQDEHRWTPEDEEG